MRIMNENNRLSHDTNYQQHGTQPTHPTSTVGREDWVRTPIFPRSMSKIDKKKIGVNYKHAFHLFHLKVSLSTLHVQNKDHDIQQSSLFQDQ